MENVIQRYMNFRRDHPWISGVLEVCIPMAIGAIIGFQDDTIVKGSGQIIGYELRGAPPGGVWKVPVYEAYETVRGIEAQISNAKFWSIYTGILAFAAKVIPDGLKLSEGGD